MKNLFVVLTLTLLQSTFSFAETLCFNLRGNGENQLAHSGAVAKAIELYGEPQGIAGGSSATITGFLLESMKINPALSKKGDSPKRDRQLAFMMKSMQGFTYGAFEDPKWQSLFAMLGSANSSESTTAKLGTAIKALANKESPEKVNQIYDALNTAKQSGIFYGPAVQKLMTAVEAYNADKTNKTKLDNVYNLTREAKRSFDVLGNFDAKNDSNLLIREGIVNFEAMALMTGKVADFYAMKGATPALQKEMAAYVERCSKDSVDKSWSELSKDDPTCQADLSSLMKKYYAEPEVAKKHAANSSFRASEPVGAHMKTLISTAVVEVKDKDEKSASNALKNSKADYEKNFDPKQGEKLKLNGDEVKFGYWGSEKDLKAAATVKSNSNPHSKLDKSKRFESLGQTTWFNALSLSPAEPGLSAYKEFSSSNGKKYLSLGGWSDLHPVPVSKAMGCTKNVYISRKGGDSMFGQGLAKRVFGFDNKTWDDLDPKSKAAMRKNRYGDEDDMASQWSKMYNLKNPDSSYAASLKAADAVMCTDWDKFSPTNGIDAMITESYKAPVYQSGKIKSIGLVKPTFLSASQKDKVNSEGFLEYAGCIPRDASVPAAADGDAHDTSPAE